MEQIQSISVIDGGQWNWIPLLFVLAWSFIGLMLWSAYLFMRDLVRITQRLHRIPCANCRYSTGDHHLKCTVRPAVAFTDESIHCSDFQP